MSPKAMAGVYVLWITLFIFSSSMDGLLMATGRDSLINNMITTQIANIQGSGILQIPLMAVGFVQAFLSMITWDFPMYNNDLGIILKIVLLYPVSLVVVISIIQFLANITSSTAGTVAMVGGLIGAGAVAFANLLGG